MISKDAVGTPNPAFSWATKKDWDRLERPKVVRSPLEILAKRKKVTGWVTVSVVPRTVLDEALKSARAAKQNGRTIETVDIFVDLVDSLLLDERYSEVRQLLRDMDPDEWDPSVLTAILMVTRTAHEVKVARVPFGRRCSLALARAGWSIERVRQAAARLDF